MSEAPPRPRRRRARAAIPLPDHRGLALEPPHGRGEDHERLDEEPGRGHDETGLGAGHDARSEEHTSELQSQSNLVCRLLLETKKKQSTSASIAWSRETSFAPCS